MDSWFLDALAISRKRLRPSSVEVYSSRWKGLCSAVALEPGAALTTKALGAGLGQLPSYLAQKRALELCLWVCDTLVRAGRLPSNPAFELHRHFFDDSRPLHSVPIVEHLGDALARAAEGLASGWKLQRLRAVGHLAALGLKAGELRTLPKAAWSPSRAVLGPGGLRREIAVPSTSVKAFEDWLGVHPAPESPLFLVANEQGNALDAATVWRQVCKLQKGSGLPLEASGTSGLRALLAGNLLQQGVEPAAVQESLGHRDIASTHELLRRIRLLEPRE